MLRFLLAPRQVALHLLAIALVAAMGWLSLWQLGKAQGDEVPGSGSVVPLAEVSRLGSAAAAGAYDRTVTATGRYDVSRQVRVPNRQLDGRVGAWVVAPLRLDDGGAVAVVRGWVGEQAEPAPAGTVTVTGRLLPPEEAPARASGLAADEVSAVDLSVLTPRWPYPLHEGFVVARDELPAPNDAPKRVPEANAVPSDTGAPFSNLGYALQWWAFAAFVGFLWWRILLDRWRERAGRTPSIATLARS